MLLQSRTAAFLQVLRDEIDGGALSLEAAGAQVITPGTWRQVKALVRSVGCAGAGQLPFFFALARGMRERRSVTVGVRLTSVPNGMDNVTGIPLALGLRQLLGHRLDATGVHPPETVIEAGPLLEALAPTCDPPKRSFDELVVVTEAGDDGGDP